MLLQSHLGYIEFLPAIPDEWQQGYVKGLVARGNFEVGMEWNGGSLTSAEILSKNGGTCTLKYDDMSLATIRRADGTLVKTEYVDRDKISFDTVAGETYFVTNIPAGLALKSAPSGGTATRTDEMTTELN